jgi:transposase
VAPLWKPYHCRFTSGTPQRGWQCPVCDLVHERDVNAAINILNQSTVGATGHLHRTQVQVSHAWGQSVRPAFAPAIGQRWMNQEANLL